MLHWEPFFGDFQIQLGVSQSTLFEALAKIGCTASTDIVQYRLRDKAAAVAFSGHSVKNSESRIWEDDIDAFAHITAFKQSISMVHTFRVYVQWLHASPFLTCAANSDSVRPLGCFDTEVDMSAKRTLCAHMGAAGIAAFLLVWPSQVGAQQLRIGSNDIGGVVTSAKGPEAGVWVIAETTGLGTKRYAKIVVTDDQGRYLLPSLPPGAQYNVWVRGFGLINSPRVDHVRSEDETVDVCRYLLRDASLELRL